MPTIHTTPPPVGFRSSSAPPAGSSDSLSESNLPETPPPSYADAVQNFAAFDGSVPSAGWRYKSCLGGLGARAVDELNQINQASTDGLPPGAVAVLISTGETGDLGHKFSDLAPPKDATPAARAAYLSQWLTDKLTDAGHITLRTGTIVLLTTMIRELVSYYVQEALDASDMSAANQAWACAAVILLGPCINLAGLIRDELGNEANLQTRLGRLAMCGITFGAWIAAHLTGATENLLANSVGTSAYVFLRDIANAFFPLSDNAGAPTVAAGALGMAQYGLVQSALEKVLEFAPVCGASRAAAGLDPGYLSALLVGAVNAVGSVIDDGTYYVSRLLFPAEQAPVDAIPKDEPEARSQARTRARFPTLTNLSEKITTNMALRGSASVAINASLAALAVHLANEGVEGEPLNNWLVLGVGVMVMMIYLPFIYGCQQNNRGYAPNG